MQLTSTGALDAAFQPLRQRPGSVTALARQTDGKLMVGGDFMETTGQPLRRLARLTATGTVDATFSTTTGFDGPVVGLAVQPDGRILTNTYNAVRRFLASGSPYNSLSTPDFSASGLRPPLLQSDGRILLGGDNLPGSGTTTTALLRLLPNGTRDGSFVLNTTSLGSIRELEALELSPTAGCW